MWRLAVARLYNLSLVGILTGLIFLGFAAGAECWFLVGFVVVHIDPFFFWFCLVGVFRSADVASGLCCCG